MRGEMVDGKWRRPTGPIFGKEARAGEEELAKIEETSKKIGSLEAANREKIWSQMEKLKKLHFLVHSDPPIAQSARAHWPEILDEAVWVPHHIHDSKCPVQHLYFLTVCQDPQIADANKRIRLVVIEYNDDPPPKGSIREELKLGPSLRLAKMIPLHPGFLADLMGTYSMFFTYIQSPSQKLAYYRAELEHKKRMSGDLTLKEKFSD